VLGVGVATVVEWAGRPFRVTLLVLLLAGVLLVVLLLVIFIATLIAQRSAFITELTVRGSSVRGATALLVSAVVVVKKLQVGVGILSAILRRSGCVEGFVWSIGEIVSVLLVVESVLSRVIRPPCVLCTLALLIAKLQKGGSGARRRFGIVEALPPVILLLIIILVSVGVIVIICIDVILIINSARRGSATGAGLAAGRRSQQQLGSQLVSGRPLRTPQVAAVQTRCGGAEGCRVVGVRVVV
jgi:hypothetical protein